jgi:transposase
MNKTQREARNAAMIADRTAGMKVKDIADKYGVRTQTVWSITRWAIISTRDMIHARLEEHGLDGIREWADGESISYPSLSQYLRETGYRLPRKVTQKRVPAKVSKVYATIAALQGGAAILAMT